MPLVAITVACGVLCRRVCDGALTLRTSCYSRLSRCCMPALAVPVARDILR
eukprot:COSAG02_NODE_41878_length_390_cov_0.635739_1_plen_50_part_01